MKDKIAIKTSVKGSSVRSASDRNLTFDSDKEGLGVYLVKFISYTFPDNPPTRTLTYSHDLGFYPMHWGMYKADRGLSGNTRGILLWVDAGYNAVGDWDWTQTWDISVDNNNFYLEFTSTDINPPFGTDNPPKDVTGETFEFKVYLFGVKIG